MPRQVYRCPEHGEFEITVTLDEEVPKSVLCLVPTKDNKFHCVRRATWVPSAPNFIGGPTTGAGNK